MILIIDDDQAVTASLALLLKQAGFASHAAASPDEAIEVLRRQPCQLVLQDMNFSRRTSGEEGLALLQRIKALTPALPVVLITAWGSIDLAVEGMKAGAADFVTKPWTNQQMLETVQDGARRSSRRAATAARSRGDRATSSTRASTSASSSAATRRCCGCCSSSAASRRPQASVLITGESGTGKELIAEALHRNSPRADRAFVKVNLGGISSSLFESEMFGHVRGAFTDARADRKGRFEVAHGGTIFLDEIGDLDPASQVKMLRVLQDRTYEVLGSSQQPRGRRARRLGDQPRPARHGRARRVPRGPALPHQPDRGAPAAAARAARRHPAARLALPAGRGAQPTAARPSC